MKPLAVLILLSTVLLIDLQRRRGAQAGRRCSQYCKTNHCDRNTGECYEGCKPGFFTKTCDGICQCGGGACGLLDGTCIDVSTLTSAPVSQGCASDSEGYIRAALPVVIIILCLLVITLSYLLFTTRCEEKTLKGYRRKDQQPCKHGEDESMIQNEEQNHLLWKTLKKMLGVHFLNTDAESRNPVVLFCVQMKFDKKRVNTCKTSLTEDRKLVNKPSQMSGEEFPERFTNFHGTTALSPTFQGDCPTYWEVHCNVELKETLQTGTLLLCIGLCREADRDVCFQIPSRPNCYSLTVGFCNDHNEICTKIFKEFNIGENPSAHKETGISNVSNESDVLKYGILVCKGKKVIIFFCMTNNQQLCRFEKIDFEEPLWPMFGVFNESASNPSVKMKLETTRYIDMSSDKKSLILGALSSPISD